MRIAVAFEGWRCSAQELQRQRSIVARAAKRFDFCIASSSLHVFVLHWRLFALNSIATRCNVSKSRSFRRLSCVRLIFLSWAKFIVRIHPRELAIRPCLVLLQTKRASVLAVVFRIIAHWRGLVVAKHARASEFAAHSLLHFTFGMFVSIWSRRRSRAKELMLACTLLDQVLTWIFISGRFSPSYRLDAEPLQ
jgi:hypothetical protein